MGRPSDAIPLAQVRLLIKDRKSTRLNSSHGYIAYAVFCLKKKTPHHTPPGLDRPQLLAMTLPLLVELVAARRCRARADPVPVFARYSALMWELDQSSTAHD